MNDIKICLIVFWVPHVHVVQIISCKDITQITKTFFCQLLYLTEINISFIT